MKVEIKNPPRTFKPRGDNEIIISDYGKVYLESYELITVVSESNKPFDLVKREWGTSTSSLNHRVKSNGFKVALVKNQSNLHYIMAVDTDKLQEFENYCDKEEQEVERWLDEL